MSLLQRFRDGCTHDPRRSDRIAFWLGVVTGCGLVIWLLLVMSS